MLRATMALLALLLLPGCGARPEPPAPEPESTLLRIGVAAGKLTLCEGMTRSVAVGAQWLGDEPPDTAGLPEITWMSTDAEVASVDPRKGAITGVSPGTATVIVHGRLGSAYGRTTLPVTVLPGRWDEEVWKESGTLACKPA